MGEVVTRVKSAVSAGIDNYKSLPKNTGLTLAEGVALYLYTWEVAKGFFGTWGFFSPLNGLLRTIAKAKAEGKKPHMKLVIQIEMWAPFQNVLTRARQKLDSCFPKVVFRSITGMRRKAVFGDKKIGETIRLDGNVSTTSNKDVLEKFSDQRKWNTMIRWLSTSGAPIKQFSNVPEEDEHLFENMELQIRFRVEDKENRTLTLYCGLPVDTPKLPKRSLEKRVNAVLRNAPSGTAKSKLLLNRYEGEQDKLNAESSMLLARLAKLMS